MSSPRPLTTTNQPDRLTILPPELLLIITSHLVPNIHRYECTGTPYESDFLSNPSLLALSRTCKYLHIVLTPELVKAVVRATENPLWFAIKRAHLGLATKLLEEGWLEATEDELVYWVVRGGERLLFFTGEDRNTGEEEGDKEESGREAQEREDGKREEARELVVRTLIKLGAGKRLGREWHAMVQDRWPGRWGIEYSMLRGVRRLLFAWRVKT